MSRIDSEHHEHDELPGNPLTARHGEFRDLVLRALHATELLALGDPVEKATPVIVAVGVAGKEPQVLRTFIQRGERVLVLAGGFR